MSPTRRAAIPTAALPIVVVSSQALTATGRRYGTQAVLPTSPPWRERLLAASRGLSPEMPVLEDRQ